jgi:hypothetical protein
MKGPVSPIVLPADCGLRPRFGPWVRKLRLWGHLHLGEQKT